MGRERSLDDNCRVMTSSSGCVSGIALILGHDVTKLRDIYDEMADECLAAGTPVGRMSVWLRRGLEQMVPNDEAAKRCSGRLHVAYTQLPLFTQIVKSEFRDREDLVAACLGSAFIPVYFTEVIWDGSYPRLDAGFVNNSPKLSKQTICFHPNDANSEVHSRISIRMFSAPKLQDRDEIVRMGREDTTRYLAALESGRSLGSSGEKHRKCDDCTWGCCSHRDRSIAN